MFGARLASVRLKLLRRREFCSNKNKPTEPNTTTTNNNNKTESHLSKYEEQYQQLQNLDFMTAAKMVFSDPPKKRKFGIDFHLVQLFFACLPSLAVYLVAQYARREMKKMDAEFERKKKEEEEKSKEIEAKAIEEKESGSAELLDVKERLNKLEETVKEIVVESKKQPSSAGTKNQEDGEKKISSQDGSSSISPESGKMMDNNQSSKQKPEGTTSGPSGSEVTGSPLSDASQQEQADSNKNKGAFGVPKR